MPVLNPLSTTLQMIQDAGTVDGKAVTKSVTIRNIDANASPDILLRTAASLDTVIEHPTIEVRRNEAARVVE